MKSVTSEVVEIEDITEVVEGTEIVPFTEEKVTEVLLTEEDTAAIEARDARRLRATERL